MLIEVELVVGKRNVNVDAVVLLKDGANGRDKMTYLHATLYEQ